MFDNITYIYTIINPTTETNINACHILNLLLYLFIFILSSLIYAFQIHS